MTTETSSKPDPKLRGLGRGLNALFEDEEGVYPQVDPQGQTPGRARQMLGVEQLSPGRFQPRQTFSPSSIDILAASIRAYGVLQPIVVRRDPVQADHYEIIAGERRWRAAQQAQLHEVPVVVLDLDDKAALEIALVENLQREDLNPVDEAAGYKRLMDEFDYTQEQVAIALGRSRPYIANMVRLLTLPPKVLEFVERGELSPGHARALVPAKDPLDLALLVMTQDMNVRETERLAAGDGSRAHKKGKASAAGKDADTLALETELSNQLGMKVLIEARPDHSGQVRIAFKSLDQLDDVLQRLAGGGRGPRLTD